MSKYSSYKKDKLIFENWRRFINEQDNKPKSNSFCDNFPDFCKQAYGTVRANMPQIPDAGAFEKEIEAPPPDGLETNEPQDIPDLGQATRDYLNSSDDKGEWPKGDQVSVDPVSGVDPSKLKPTQKDIYMDNALKKVAAAEAGNWFPWDASVLVSKDGYLLDGHHRWAATIVYNSRNPENKQTMNIEKVDMPIKNLLKVANAYTDAIGGPRHKGGGTNK